MSFGKSQRARLHFPAADPTEPDFGAVEAMGGFVGEFKDLVRRYPGDARVIFTIETSEGPVTYELGPAHRVEPEPGFFIEARELLGEAAIL